jgi:hypothetical protein
VLDALATGDDIEGNVQDMVGFVIRQRPLEQVKVVVDVLDELDFLSQQKAGSDATGAESPDAISIFVVDIGGRHHGPRPLGCGRIVEPFLDSPSTLLEDSLLAGSALFSESTTYSKAPSFWNNEHVISSTLFQKSAGFSSFFSKIAPGRL